MRLDHGGRWRLYWEYKLICMAILSRRCLYPIENIISDISFQAPFPWNFPAPNSLTLLFTEPHVLSSKPAIVDLLRELHGLGF